MPFAVKRVYEPPAASDGLRVLVDRLWPRGVARATARIDLWVRDIAPSDALRQWYGHEPERWAEFRRRYADESRARPDVFERLIEAARSQTVTLLFSSREARLNNAVALKMMLENAEPPKRRTPKRRTRSGTKDRRVASRGA